jgi:hypothetical protein
MAKILEEIQYDLRFVKGHTVQPKWYKALKSFVLIVFLVCYWLVFGWRVTLVFCLVFFALALGLHMLYRVKTNRFTQTWLDFKVIEVDGKPKPVSIGIYYYTAVIAAGLSAFLISQLVA